MDWIFFGVAGIFGALAVSLVFGFIFMVAFELLSIAVEETFNLLFDTASLIVWCVKRIISVMIPNPFVPLANQEAADDEIISL